MVAQLAQVLVVEDDQSIREVVASALQEAGYDVIQARDGVEALGILQDRERPLVVLLDLVMPRMSGIEVLQAVASAAQAVATDHRLARHAYVLVTANRELLPPPLEQLVMPLSFAIVDKPFDLDELLQSVQTAAGRLETGAAPDEPPDAHP